MDGAVEPDPASARRAMIKHIRNFAKLARAFEAPAPGRRVISAEPKRIRR
jgi:hypothetical protein